MKYRARLILCLGSQLGLTEDIRDPEFKAGQLSRARDLGDGKVTADDKFDPAWDERFKGKIDGLILVRIYLQSSLHIPDSM